MKIVGIAAAVCRARQTHAPKHAATHAFSRAPRTPAAAAPPAGAAGARLSELHIELVSDVSRTAKMGKKGKRNGRLPGGAAVPASAAGQQPPPDAAHRKSALAAAPAAAKRLPPRRVLSDLTRAKSLPANGSQPMPTPMLSPGLRARPGSGSDGDASGAVGGFLAQTWQPCSSSATCLTLVCWVERRPTGYSHSVNTTRPCKLGCAMTRFAQGDVKKSALTSAARSALHNRGDDHNCSPLAAHASVSMSRLDVENAPAPAPAPTFWLEPLPAAAGDGAGEQAVADADLKLTDPETRWRAAGTVAWLAGTADDDAAATADDADEDANTADAAAAAAGIADALASLSGGKVAALPSPVSAAAASPFGAVLEAAGPGTDRHVITCRSTQETRVQNAFDDVASSIRQALGSGARRGRRRPAAVAQDGDVQDTRAVILQDPRAVPPRPRARARAPPRRHDPLRRLPHARRVPQAQGLARGGVRARGRGVIDNKL